MAVELSGIVLDHLTRVSVREHARIVHHEVPGMSGGLAQALGRVSVEVSLCGLFYGPSAIEGLNRLRAAYLGNEPVDFFADSVGDGYFTRVLISRLEVHQRAGHLDQFDFACDVVEYVEPPEPVAVDPLAALDSSLLEDAASFVDDAQNGLEQVSQLIELLNAPTFANPVEALPEMADEYRGLVEAGVGSLTGVRNLFLGTPE